MEKGCFGLNSYAEEFFLYEYFGIVRNSIKIGGKTVFADNIESAATKCAYRAYLDLCRTLEYDKKPDKIQAETKINREVFCICTRIAKALLSEDELGNRKGKAYQIFFDENWEYKSDVLCCVPDNTTDTGKRYGKPFYFGHAQKWVNMTIKYLWLIGIINDVDNNTFEAPIDSLIMEAASNDLSVVFPRNNKTYNASYNQNNIDTSQWKEYSGNATMPWSKLEKKEYEQIQKCIKCQAQNVVEWENNAWIAQSVLNTEENKKPFFKINLGLQ